MAEAEGGEVADQVYHAIKKPPGNPRGLGPIKTLVSQVPFLRAHLITQYSGHFVKAFSEWLDCPTEIHLVNLDNPTNYRVVFEIANKEFAKVQETLTPEERLCVHLSPGTPTMAAVSVLLAKTRFPATLYQTHEGEIQEEDVPFDIQLDYLPELLRDSDFSFQALASRSPADIEGFEDIIGNSQSLKLAVGRSQRAALRDVNVLITGESGTGKELIAKAIHISSPRGQNKKNRFVPINCAAIPDTLFESELFGTTKGAATDVKERPGAFREADKGTLFLDEVGELSLENQAKLLRALQPQHNDPPCRRWVQRVGAETPDPVDVRIIAATNRNLVGSIMENGFRDDLYYRLATVTIELPSLRERRSDIPHLAREFMNRINREFAASEPGYQDKRLLPAALSRLKRHEWPGNVRELNNVLVQAAVMSLEPTIGRRDVDAAITQMPGSGHLGPLARERGSGFNLKERLAEIERVFIEDALEESDGNQSKAAKMLGVSQQNLSKKCKNRG